MKCSLNTITPNYNRLKNVLSKAVESYHGYLAEKQSTKSIIQSTIGEAHAIVRPFEDFGSSFYSFLSLFKRRPVHYAAFEGNSRTGIGFGDRYTHHIGLTYDKNKALSTFKVFNNKTKEVTIYDKFGNIIKHYTPEETKAIQYYKRDSKNIHKLLRYNKSVKNESEIKENIAIIKKIFEDKSKISTAEHDFIAYRALDDKALKAILAMPEDGMVYVEPSLLSVATEKSSTYQFMGLKNHNHILKLKIPKGAEFLNMDEIAAGRIINPQLSEHELLFLPGCKILVTNRHAKGGFIEATLIK